MLTVEPAEPVIYNVRLHQAYRTTVTLKNQRAQEKARVTGGMKGSSSAMLAASTVLESMHLDDIDSEDDSNISDVEESQEDSGQSAAESQEDSAEDEDLAKFLVQTRARSASGSAIE